MTSEANVQYHSGQSLLGQLNLGGPLLAPPNLLAGLFPLAHASPSSAPLQNPPEMLLFVLKLHNVPTDLTLREAALVFSLVADDVVSIELADFCITATFSNLNTCVLAGKLLDGKYVFGSKYAPVKVEYDNSVAVAAAKSAFDNMRLSGLGISPPSSHPLPSQPGYDFQKRASVGNQRSRFLFSDPFSGTTTPTNNNSGSIDLSDLTGKSLLLMENRDFDSVRDPWGPQAQGNLSFSSNPQTPGLSAVHGNLNWGANGQSATQTQPPATSGSVSLASAPGISDRRRTSSFFNGQTKPAPPAPQIASTASQQAPPPAASQTVAAILSQGPSLQSNGLLLTMPANGSRPISSAPTQPQQPASSTTPTTNAGSMAKDVPDLSLLARVPPPANPADQNPPCNTLYVGNLPPDATEAELRSLFAPQKGFRRLSFRTKNQTSAASNGSSGHNHGPMCFVEFEDVAHATVALAELYGRALPRPNGSNGKGGIRLSFSKNPLGVRGPGNPRRTSANQSAPAAGVGNYGYLNFQ